MDSVNNAMPNDIGGSQPYSEAPVNMMPQPTFSTPSTVVLECPTWRVPSSWTCRKAQLASTPAIAIKSFSRMGGVAAPTVSPKLDNGSSVDSVVKNQSQGTRKLAINVKVNGNSSTKISKPGKRVSPPRRAKTNFSSVVGAIVQVASRTWPGINKPGGMARITRINREQETCNVSYVLGGSEKGVSYKYITDPKFESENIRESKKRDFYGEFVQDPWEKKPVGKRKALPAEKSKSVPKKVKTVSVKKPEKVSAKVAVVKNTVKVTLKKKAAKPALAKKHEKVSVGKKVGKISVPTKVSSAIKKAIVKKSKKVNSKSTSKRKRIEVEPSRKVAAKTTRASPEEKRYPSVIYEEIHFEPTVDYTRDVASIGPLPSAARLLSANQKMEIANPRLFSQNGTNPMSLENAHARECACLETRFRFEVARINAAFLNDLNETLAKEGLVAADKQRLCTAFEVACQNLDRSWRPLEAASTTTVTIANVTAKTAIRAAVVRRHKQSKQDMLARHKIMATTLKSKHEFQLRSVSSFIGGEVPMASTYESHFVF